MSLPETSHFVLYHNISNCSRIYNTIAPQTFKKINYLGKSLLLGKHPVEAAGRLLRFAENLLKITRISKGPRTGVDQNVPLATLAMPPKSQ